MRVHTDTGYGVPLQCSANGWKAKISAPGVATSAVEITISLNADSQKNMEMEEYTPRSACESLKVYDEERKKKGENREGRRLHTMIIKIRINTRRYSR